MFITPIDSKDSNSPFNTYDPLLTNHLTNGQMGYLPNAQFMTPAQYGAFRTVPSGNYVTNQEMNPSLLYNYIIANRGFGILNTYNPGVNPMRRNIMAQRTIADAQTAIALGLGETGLSMGAGMLAGGIGGLALGFGVGAIATAATAPYLDRLRHAREIQRATMSRITYGSDVALGLGQGFNMQAAYNVGTSLRRMSIADPFFNKEDYDNMLRIGMDSGMFDFANNADQYVRTLKTVQKNFKTMMTLFETLDMDEIGRQMKRMQAMGVSNENMGGIAGLEKTYARMLGISHGDAINMYGQQGALIATNLGIAGIHGSTMNLSVAGRLEAARRAGILTPMQISALGGVSGAAQTITMHNLSQGKNSSFMHALMGYTALNGDPTKIDEAALTELLNSNEPVDKIVNKGLTNINAYLAKNVGKNSARLKAASAHYMNNIQSILGTQGYDLLLNKWRLSQARLSPELSLENILAMEGMSPEQIEAFMAINSPDALSANYTNIKTTKNALIQDYIERTEPAFFKDLITKAGKKLNSGYDWVVGGIAAKHTIFSDRDENKEAGIIAGASSDIYRTANLNDIIKIYSHSDYTRLAARGGAKFLGLVDGNADRIGTSILNKGELQNIYNLYDNASLLNSSYTEALNALTGIMQNEHRGKSISNRSMDNIAAALRKADVDYDDIVAGRKTTREALLDAIAGALASGGAGGGLSRAQLKKILQGLSNEQLSALVGKNLVNNASEQRILLKSIGDIDKNVTNNIAAGVNLDINNLYKEMIDVYGTDLINMLGITESGLKGLVADGSYKDIVALIDRIGSGAIADNNLSGILNDKEAMALLSKFGVKNSIDLRNLVQQIHKAKIANKSRTDLKNAYSIARNSLYQQMSYTMYSSLGEYGITSDEFEALHSKGSSLTVDDIVAYMDNSIDSNTKHTIANRIKADLEKGSLVNLSSISKTGTSAYSGIIDKTADSQTVADLAKLNKDAEAVQQMMLLFSNALNEGLLSTAGKQSIDTLNTNIANFNNNISNINNTETLENLNKTLTDLNNVLGKLKVNMGTPQYPNLGGY